MKTAIKDAKSTQDLVKQAGLNWGVHLTQATYANSLGQVQDIPGKFAVVRSDIDHPLGVVGKRYETVNNAQALGILDGLLESGCSIADAGMYNHGATVFATVDLGHFDVGGGDVLKRKIRVSTAHDGSGSIKVSMYSWRMICKNGLHGWGRDQSVRIRHTSGWRNQMAQARHVLGIADRYYTWFEAQAVKLASAPAWRSDVETIAKNWFNENTTKGQNAIQQVVELFHYGKGNNGRTWWDGYNGLTEYVDHYQSPGRSEEKRERSSTVGAGMKLKQTALRDIVQHLSIQQARG
jgi:phage/plasmid-like protein (TIGR03299 family)